MSLIGLLNLIRAYFHRNSLEYRADALGKLNPHEIHVENIRSVFNVSFRAATYYCEKAVHHNFFAKKYVFKCPQCGVVAHEFTNKLNLPDTIACGNCRDMDETTYEFSINERDLEEVYELTEDGG